MIDKSTLANIHSYVEDKVGYVILDNPSRLNAISLSMWEKIGILLKEYEKNNNIRCVVLKGKGKKAFSAGADISEFNDNRSQSDTVLKYDNVSKNSLQILQRFSKPTIALIDGYCIGGGLATALSCDIRLASKK